MKFAINKKGALTALEALVRIIPKKAAVPVIENALVAAKDGFVSMLATDLDTSLAITLRAGENSCEVLEEGISVIPAKLLADILKQVEDETVTVTVKDCSCEILWDKGHSVIPVFDPKDFPEVQLTVKEGCSFDIPGGELLQGLAATSYACLDDGIHPTLGGILFDCGPDGLTMVASDTRRLAIREIPSVTTEEKDSFILHKKTAAVIKGLVSSEDTVGVRFDNQRMTFRVGDTNLCCRGITGKFPNYRSVIPKDNKNILTVDPKAFCAALRRVTVCASRESYQVKVNLSSDAFGGTAEITARDLGYGTDGMEKMAVDYSGDPMDIGFKSTLLCEAVESIEDEKMIMKLDGPKRPAFIVPGNSGQGSKTSVVVMPMMVA